MTDAKPHPGLTPERVSMFTDAVLAIAITLLALEIPRPSEKDLEDLGRFLSEQSGAFFAFALAFVMLWFAWRAHHTLLDQLREVSQATLAVHVPLLLFAAFLPYTTHLFGEAGAIPRSAPIAVAMFSGTEAVIMICLALLFTLTVTQKLHNADADARRLVTWAAVTWGIGLWWALSAATALLGKPDIAITLWWITPVVTLVIALVRRRARVS
ncbi:TMEM175 family protein [Nonomuraea sediminis]|uniref:TMEM175 family protein n=1 Tax=Nonomuraea sediminis TaxID=2835864 RepID=UPI001BDC789F|nr:TMEM175 family protein [Nonomuraea sediminis]